MAIAMQGLKARRQYEDLIGVAVLDGFENIRFPNRNASFLRNGFVISQLDGEGMRTVERQQAKNHIKNTFQNRLLQTLGLIYMIYEMIHIKN